MQFSRSTLLERGRSTYKTLGVLGPEHEFSVVDDELKPLPIVDRIIKDFRGRIVNFIEQPTFTFGKELQMHVMEVKPNKPFASPVEFEETMHDAVLSLTDSLRRKYAAHLLGTGMHPLLRLTDTGVWPHRHRQIYEEFDRIFNLQQHGWLNIQSFQLNLSYAGEKSAMLVHNLLAVVCAYVPAIAASSPIFEGELVSSVDNRLEFYMTNQQEVPSIVGDVIPEYVNSVDEYRKKIIRRYSLDLAKKGASRRILDKDWVNSRGAIFRFDRKAIEIRVMDEQECIRSDVALSCFIRALLRGLMENDEAVCIRHSILVKDFHATVKNGLEAKTQHPKGRTAREMCRYLLKVASKHSTGEERKYLQVVEKRIAQGNLAETIRRHVLKKAQKADMKEAITSVYSRLSKSLIDNEPYF
jgi:gamma-glutamyl:cysteine ligase YbdK (ATP-grasp superfamily)